jgi:hypothetical protein
LSPKVEKTGSILLPLKNKRAHAFKRARKWRISAATHTSPALVPVMARVFLIRECWTLPTLFSIRF